ncbi:hypothetical protein O3P69_016534 [Scylla paramamosain]|uniref:Uncharacterized protein n=1 Tax=Scylla paramamosain TaxID=85552 RepID=A0AAW0TEM8_SCYPA
MTDVATLRFPLSILGLRGGVPSRVPAEAAQQPSSGSHRGHPVKSSCNAGPPRTPISIRNKMLTKRRAREEEVVVVVVVKAAPLAMVPDSPETGDRTLDRNTSLTQRRVNKGITTIISITPTMMETEGRGGREGAVATENTQRHPEAPGDTHPPTPPLTDGHMVKCHYLSGLTPSAPEHCYGLLATLLVPRQASHTGRKHARKGQVVGVPELYLPLLYPLSSSSSPRSSASSFRSPTKILVERRRGSWGAAGGRGGQGGRGQHNSIVVSGEVDMIHLSTTEFKNGGRHLMVWLRGGGGGGRGAESAAGRPQWAADRGGRQAVGGAWTDDI